VSIVAAPPSSRLPHRTTLAPFRYGGGDPTTRLTPGEFWRATLTPHGPATVHIDWRDGTVRVNTWGTGSDWLAETVPHLIGLHDAPVTFTEAHPAIMRAQRNHPHLLLGASRDLYHELLPIILGQRITAGEACTQWRRLCLELGESAPGPHADLRLPPAPDRLAHTPSWWFHPLGIERKRAEPLIAVAKYADRLWQWMQAGSTETARHLVMLPGVGEWTIGLALASALGEPDAVAVGDFHVKNSVAWALAGEPRGTDERMLQLLEPYRGQRGRVVKLLQLEVGSAPKFGPRKRILPMAQW
jgi:3-methyladenine DNA glycosylase/8-oxoguanine DNA glycosylase